MFRAPGRINIIGEHVDYNGGFVLPATVDLYTWGAAAPRDDRVLEVYLCADDSFHRIDLDRLSPYGGGEATEYIRGVAWALQRAGVEISGGNLVIGGDLPLGGGLSSSASLELLLATALTTLAGANVSAEQLASLCHEAESEFVGMQCGIMDQYAVALGAPGQAMLLDCDKRDFSLHTLPADARFVITHSGVSHRLPAGGYNTRRDECRAALSLLQGIPSLAQLAPGRLEAERPRLGELLFRRCRHVITEVERVHAAVKTLESSDLPALGSLMTASHLSLRDDYEVSCTELDTLVEVALATEGILGSRMMGGGFGGCTISLAYSDAAQDAARRIAAGYARHLGETPWQHVAGPAAPLAEVDEEHEPG